MESSPERPDSGLEPGNQPLVATDFREDVVDFLWREYERLMVGNVPVEISRNMREAFIAGFSGAHGLFANIVPKMSDADATIFLTRMNAELRMLREQIRTRRRERKGIV